MLYLDLETIMANKGIKEPSKLLVKAGITYPAAYRLLYVPLTTINLARLEQLCTILNCTPNDVLVWKPEGELPGKKHPLHSLRREKNSIITEQLQALPVSKLDAARKFIEELGGE